MRQVSERSWLTVSSQQTLRDFAAMTGGKAFYNNNDISGLFKRAVDDSSSYYLLGYYLDTKNTKPGWRKLTVKLHDKEKQSGAEVRSRTGFFVTNATMNPNVVRQSDLDFAVLSPFDSTGLPVTARWLNISSEASMKLVQFGLQLAPNALTLGAENLVDFDVLTLAYDKKDGKEADKIAKTVRGNLSQDRLALFQAKGGNFSQKLKLAQGDYVVRFVVRDNVSGKIGSVSAPLTVN